MQDANDASINRHARALRILSCLQMGPHFNARELARRLNVSRRTIYRDIHMMREAGVPIRFDELLEAYELDQARSATPLPRFSERELLHIISLIRMSHLQRCDAFSDSAQSCLAQILPRYPAHVQLRASRIINACSVAEPTCCSLTGDILQAILHAIEQQKQVKIMVPLEGPDSPMEWVQFAPYRFLASDDGWEIVGRSSLHRNIQRFQVPEIHNVEFTNEPFVVPRGYRSRPRHN